MKFIKLGTTDLNVSRITLGTWAIGGKHWGEYDEENAVTAIETAIDNGINIIDTAPAYGSGHAEELIGRVLHGRQGKVIIATKCGIDTENNFRISLSPEFIEKDLAGSLRRLRTDCIDLYQCHWPDPATPLEKTMEALLRFQREGKIRYIGVSNFNSEAIGEALNYAPVVSLQPQYSLLERDIESGVQKFCVEKNIALIPYGTLGAGVLTGKYPDRPRFRKDDARSFFYKFFQEKYWPRVKALVDTLTRIADSRGAAPGHIAIAWLLSREGVASALVGARNPGQVKDNLAGTEIFLSQEETGTLDAASENLYSW